MQDDGLIAALTRLARRFAEVTARPGGKRPLTRGELTSWGALSLLTLGMLAVAVSMAPSVERGGFVLAAALLAYLGRAMAIRTSNDGLEGGEIVFLAICAALLSPAEAALVIVSLAAVEVAQYVRRASWVLVVGGNAFAQVMPLLAVALLHRYTDMPTVVGACASVALYVVLSAWPSTVTISLAYYLAGSEGPAGVRARVRAALRDAEDSQLVVQAAGDWAMATVGVLACMLAPATLPLLLVPFLISWRSAMHAARLEEAERQIGTDSLTGLSNRARFLERSEEEFRLADRYGHPVAAVMCDLDDFKRLNDTHGHLVGDEALKAAADALAKVRDEHDVLVARYGGEEFIMLLPAISRERVLEVAELVRLGVRRVVERWDSSLSLGVAMREPGESFESLVARADKALYQAKFAGKDRVVEWQPDDARDAA